MLKFSQIVSIIAANINTMHTEQPQHGHAEKKPNYIPFIVVVAILGLMAWTLLHNFEGGNKGNMWADHSAPATESHEGH